MIELVTKGVIVLALSILCFLLVSYSNSSTYLIRISLDERQSNGVTLDKDKINAEICCKAAAPIYIAFGGHVNDSLVPQKQVSLFLYTQYEKEPDKRQLDISNDGYFMNMVQLGSPQNPITKDETYIYQAKVGDQIISTGTIQADTTEIFSVNKWLLTWITGVGLLASLLQIGASVREAIRKNQNDKKEAGKKSEPDEKDLKTEVESEDKSAGQTPSTTS